MKTFVKFANYSLAICLIVVALLLAYVAVPAFGNNALIVRSGSMEPTIRTGDLIVVKVAKGITSPVPNAVSKYKEGDVIAFKGEKDPNILTTHRIVSKKQEAGKTFYQTQGDANQSPDTKFVSEEQIVGRSALTIPKAGKIFAFAKTRNGFALLVLIPALLLIAIESSTLIKEIIKVARARKMLLSDPTSVVEKNKLLGPIGLRILMPFVVSLMFFHNSYAYFSDSASSINNTFVAAATFPSPSPSPGGVTNHLVISEVQINGGPSHADQDFIELYNPTNFALDLNGFRLVKRTGNSSADDSIKSWTSSTLVPSHGYYLWANSSETTFPSTVGADAFTSVDLTASSTVALRNGSLNTGTLIDVLSWNDGSTLVEGNEFDPDPGAGQSLERKAYSTSNLASMTSGGIDELKGNGFDLNDNATDFILRTISQPQHSASSTESP